MAETPISAIILTQQSERTLEAVLKSLQWCDERVVVDSGSTDRSIEIAERWGARVVRRTFDGFGAQKRFGVDQARNDWVMIIDSDEVMTPELQQEIGSLFQNGDPLEQAHGFEIPIRLVFMGHRMNHARTRSNPLRLFNRRFGNFNNALVHERVELQGKILKLRHCLDHYSYVTLEDYFRKFNLYTSLAAKDLHRKQKSDSAARRWISFPLHFIRYYVKELGFLDGRAGFLWSLFCAAANTVKYTKLMELVTGSGDGA